MTTVDSRLIVKINVLGSWRFHYSIDGGYVEEYDVCIDVVSTVSSYDGEKSATGRRESDQP